MAKKKAYPTEGFRKEEGLTLANVKYKFIGGLVGTIHSTDKEFDEHPSLSVLNEKNKRIGRFHWDGETGHIRMVEVNPKYRGLKVATQMLHMATKESSKMGVAAPIHSDVRTEEGDAWAKSTGMTVPPIKSGVCRDCSELRSSSGECKCTKNLINNRAWW